jgi:hypothetical protein
MGELCTSWMSAVLLHCDKISYCTLLLRSCCMAETCSIKLVQFILSNVFILLLFDLSLPVTSRNLHSDINFHKQGARYVIVAENGSDKA